MSLVTQADAAHVLTTSQSLPFPSNGLRHVIKHMKSGQQATKLDKRLTGSTVIDQPLQEVSWATGMWHV